MHSNLIRRAEEFARKAHASIDQRRKYTGVPYIVHPKAVAEMVAQTGASAEVISAAWLHDVVEDTPVSLDQLREEFGDEIATLVDSLTDVSVPEDGNRAERVAIDRAHTALADARAKTIKLADVIHNVKDIAEHDPKFGLIFIPEKQRLLEVLREGDPVLFQLAEQTIFESLSKLNRDKSARKISD